MPGGVLEFPDISAVYGRYAALTELSPDLGGSLLLYARLDMSGVAVAIGSNVAGAASLGLEPDTERAKAALRAGICDFVVNEPGEALRILKNEIRQRRGVSVVLTGAVDALVAEIVARGVQPEVLAFPVPELEVRGARLLGVDAASELIPVTWSVDRESARWLPVLDELAFSALEKRDARARWIEASSRYLGRAFGGQRFVRMTDSEADRFIASAREAVVAGRIAAIVSIGRGGGLDMISP